MRRHERLLGVGALVAMAALCGACGGGGSSSSDRSADTAAAVSEDDQLLISFDATGDGLSDVIALDPTRNPMTIASFHAGTPSGDLIDQTSLRSGQAIDVDVSEAIAAYLAESVELAAETDLDVVDSTGKTITVTIFE